MSNSGSLPVWLGLIGSGLVAIPPLWSEWWRFRRRKLKPDDPRSKKLQILNDLAAEHELRISLTEWAPWQSFSLGGGATLICLSYLLQLW